MDLLSDILSHMKLKGTLYFRTSFTSPWGVRVPAYANVSRFHFAHKGRCFIRIGDAEAPVPLEQGDLIIITGGAPHTLYCDPATEVDAVPLDTVVEESGFTGSGALVYGGKETQHETQLICGHFAFDEHAQHPLIDALPPWIHISNYGEIAGSWMENTLKIIGNEAGREQIGGDLIALKLSEIIYAQALRAYLSSEGSSRSVLAGFTDPKIARALKVIHQDPAFPWTLDTLSAAVGLSRTAFATRFSTLMTTTPFNYITQWRMQIARQRLNDSTDAIIEIAEGVGYQSEAAFGRVFKRTFNIAPATYRRRMHLDH